jgi:competence protein ComK
VNYEFNKGTLAIVPNESNSIVYEDEERYIIEQKPLSIMEESCLYFGSSYEGRTKGAKKILGAEYKAPIVVDDINNIIAIPTTSPKSPDCVWISLSRVQNISKINNIYTKILFDNGKELIVDCSFRSLESQLSRASRLDLILRNRKNS